MSANGDFFHRLTERLDRLDPAGVQSFMLKMAREKGFLDTIFATIREGVIIIDPALKLRFVNDAAVALLGMPTEAVAREGHTIDRYLRDLEWDRMLHAEPEEWEWAARREIRVSYPTERILQFYLVPLKVESTEEQLAAILLHDVTDLHRSSATRLEHGRLEAITMLAAGVAHEIGNPLNGLTIHLQLLERNLESDEPDVEEALDAVRVSRAEVKRLDGIITQFLRALRPVQPKLAPIDLRRLLGDTITFMGHEIEDRGILVEVDLPQYVPTIEADSDQLKQAFYNIVNNAIQAMPNGGQLHLSLQSTDYDVTLHFADTGNGIEATRLDHIFQPQVTTKPEGSGLGLMIVERIVRDHGGTLSIESQQGSGTVLSLTFPLDGGRPRLASSD